MTVCFYARLIGAMQTYEDIRDMMGALQAYTELI